MWRKPKPHDTFACGTRKMASLMYDNLIMLYSVFKIFENSIPVKACTTNCRNITYPGQWFPC